MRAWFVLFQDSYVRIGVLAGGLTGFILKDYIYQETVSSVLAASFLGWGMGAYLGYSKRKKRPKFKVYSNSSNPWN